MNLKRLWPSILMTLALAACGGGSGSTESPGSANLPQTPGQPSNPPSTPTPPPPPPQEGRGQVKLGNIQGLAYQQASMHDRKFTDKDGKFEYVGNSDVMLSIGNVEVARFSPKEIINAIDFIAGGSTTDIAIINRAHFLLLLDDDTSTVTGITIDPKFHDLAKEWNIRFDSGEQAYLDDIGNVINQIMTIKSNTRIPSYEEVVAAVEYDLVCQRAGAFRGIFSGGSHGTFGFLSSAHDNALEGVAYIPAEDELIEFYGTQLASQNTDGNFLSTAVSSGATFAGKFNNVNQISGNWQNTLFNQSGSFSGDRIGGAADAQYRFTGRFTGGASGLFTFDISENDNVSGVAYVYDADDEGLYPITGSVSGNTLTAQFAGGAINGTISLSQGTLSGTWYSQAEGSSGIFQADGCQLNPPAREELVYTDEPVDPELQEPEIPTLVLGQLVTGLSAAHGERLFFLLPVTNSNQDIAVSTHGGYGDADLYLWNPLGEEVCGSRLTHNTELCVIEQPAVGIWIVEIFAYEEFGGVSLIAEIKQ